MAQMLTCFDGGVPKKFYLRILVIGTLSIMNPFNLSMFATWHPGPLHCAL